MRLISIMPDAIMEDAYSGNQNPSCFQKTVETVLDR